MDVMKRRRSCPLPYLYIILRGSLCFEADEHTFVDVPTLFHGIRNEMRFREIFILFYLFFSLFNFNRNIFFYHLVGQILRFIIPDGEMIVWISRRVGRFRATSGEFAKMEASRENSGEIGGAMRYRDLARARPNFSESLRT